MLTLHLNLDEAAARVGVTAGGESSHTFDLRDLALTERQANAFLDDPAPYGERLFAALFPAETPARAALEALPAGARLALAMDHPRLHDLPWEYLCRGGRFLATEYALLRLAPSRRAAPPAAEMPERLPFFFVPSDPLLHNGEPPAYELDLGSEWEEVYALLKERNPPCDLRRVLPPTLDALHEALAGARGALIHFTGHGTRLPDGGAALVFERRNGTDDPVPAADFADRVRGRAALVLLSACLSAAPGESLESNLAAYLCRQGVPWVIGMQLSVPNATARRFTERFYRFLLAGNGVPEAVREARLAITRAHPLEHPLLFGIPVLYAAGARQTGRLLPSGRGLALHSEPPPNLKALPIPSDFKGRKRELAQIGERLSAPRRRSGESYVPRTLTLRGAGGIGKTALLHQAAARFAWAFPDGVLALSLETLPTPAQVMGRLERFFFGPDEPDKRAALPPEERRRALLSALEGREALLAVDNYESLFHARDGGDAEAKARARALHELFAALARRGLTLLVTSRRATGLPGEGKPLDLHGLDEESGAAIFTARAARRAGEITPALARALSRRVGGHPLALRLLGPAFVASEASSLQAFLDHLDEILPDAASEWDAGRRHDTLAACFAYSLDRLDPAPGKALARLSLFRGRFPAFLAAPVLLPSPKGGGAGGGGMRGAAARTLRLLRDRSLLEGEDLPLSANESLPLYRLPPALRPFAAARLPEDERPAVEEAYFQALRALGAACYPGNEGGGVYSDALLARLAREALPDLSAAAGLRADAAGANFRFHTAFLLTHFGDLDEAMRLYRQSLDIKEALGDRKGLSATLHAMANVYVTRGDLDEAMRLYRQSLEITEALGDRKGLSATLHQMAGIYVTRGDLDEAMRLYRQARETLEALGDRKGLSATLAMMGQLLFAQGQPKAALAALLESLQTLEQIGARPDAQQVAGIIASLKDALGAQAFARLWAEVTRGAPLPPWLEAKTSEVSETSDVLSVEDLVTLCVTAARQKRPEAAQLSELTRQMAADSRLPEEIRALADVLHRILAGDFGPGLSALPPELAALLRTALDA